jgi:hypothetical protein
MASYGRGGEVTATQSKDSGGNGEVERMEIERSHNGGFIVKEYKKESGRGAMMGMLSKPTTKVAADVKALDEIVDECFGMSGAYADEEEGAGGSEGGDEGESEGGDEEEGDGEEA